MIVYLLFRIAVFVIHFIPFSLLYICSDGIAFLLHRVLAYRKKVILNNLSKAFPDKSHSAIQDILKETYQNLSDIALEGIKGLSCSEEELIRRYKFINPGLVHDIFEKDKSVIGLVAHYNNWEWGAYATPLQIKGQVVGISKSIRNPYIDRFLKKKRARFGTQIIHMNETARALIKNRDTPTLFVLIADQSPSNSRTAHWTNFLHQDTACLTGPDKIARRTNYPAVYFDVRRINRGFYEIKAILLHGNPSALDTGGLTILYMKKLEEIIIEQPGNWLWSHRRWKKRRDWNEE